MKDFAIRDMVQGRDKDKTVQGEIVFITGDLYLVHQKGLKGINGNGTQDNTENWWFRREELTHLSDLKDLEDITKKGRTLAKDVLMICKGFYEENLTTYEALEIYYQENIKLSPFSYNNCFDYLMLPCVREFLNDKNKQSFINIVYWDVCWTYSKAPSNDISFEFAMVMNTIKWLSFYVDVDDIDLSDYTEFFI